ncbi:Tyrosine recombinase [Lactiplantibacillus plantarum subsp. plantarum]|nr:Tyrosine recombinase [Lactiplantibacillus plantarum subsp. plantarum]
MQQVVLPIKDSNVLKEVQDTLLNNFKAGRRNYTIFQVGKATLLRVSDVMGLKQTDILIWTVLLNKMRSFMIEKLVSLIPCTLNQFKQNSYCIVNGCLIIN